MKVNAERREHTKAFALVFTCSLFYLIQVLENIIPE